MGTLGVLRPREFLSLTADPAERRALPVILVPLQQHHVRVHQLGLGVDLRAFNLDVDARVGGQLLLGVGRLGRGGVGAVGEGGQEQGGVRLEGQGGRDDGRGIFFLFERGGLSAQQVQLCLLDWLRYSFACRCVL